MTDNTTPPEWAQVPRVEVEERDCAQRDHPEYRNGGVCWCGQMIYYPTALEAQR